MMEPPIVVSEKTKEKIGRVRRRVYLAQDCLVVFAGLSITAVIVMLFLDMIDLHDAVEMSKRWAMAPLLLSFLVGFGSRAWRDMVLSRGA